MPESQPLREGRGKGESEKKREKGREKREREREKEKRERERKREITFLHRIVRITASLIQCLDESTQHRVYVNRAQLRGHTCITTSISSQQHVNLS